jgi:hypothetical protein
MEKSKSPETGKCETSEEQSQGLLIIFFGVKGTVHKKSFLAGQTVDFVCYCDVLRRLHKNLLRLRPELSRQKTSRHDITTTHRLTLTFFAREFLIKNNITLVPHSHYSSDLAPFGFSPIKD